MTDRSQFLQDGRLVRPVTVIASRLVRVSRSIRRQVMCDLTTRLMSISVKLQR
jgi:hypothetical protein